VTAADPIRPVEERVARLLARLEEREHTKPQRRPTASTTNLDRLQELERKVAALEQALGIVLAALMTRNPASDAISAAIDRALDEPEQDVVEAEALTPWTASPARGSQPDAIRPDR
jgi:hypothetical protein